jgi:mycoredoxin
MMLRLGLRRARVRAEWINIWDDPAAAAEVRDITGGDETSPADTRQSERVQPQRR